VKTNLAQGESKKKGASQIISRKKGQEKRVLEEGEGSNEDPRVKW